MIRRSLVQSWLPNEPRRRMRVSQNDCTQVESGDEGNRTLVDSTPAVGSGVLPLRAKRPERKGFVSTRNGFVLLNRNSTRRSGGQRSRPYSMEADGAGLEPAEPCGRLPCTPNRQPSVFRGVVREMK